MMMVSLAVRRFFNATVWGRAGADMTDPRFTGIFRWVLPLTDLFFLWFGLAGWYNGIASVQDASSATWQAWWSVAVAIVAFVALVGVSFPRLWLLELVAKGPLIGLVSVYIAIFVVNGLTGDSLVLATAGLICILILLPVWRVFDLALILHNYLILWRARRMIAKKGR